MEVLHYYCTVHIINYVANMYAGHMCFSFIVLCVRVNLYAFVLKARASARVLCACVLSIFRKRLPWWLKLKAYSFQTKMNSFTPPLVFHLLYPCTSFIFKINWILKEFVITGPPLPTRVIILRLNENKTVNTEFLSLTHVRTWRHVCRYFESSTRP